MFLLVAKPDTAYQLRKFLVRTQRLVERQLSRSEMVTIEKGRLSMGTGASAKAPIRSDDEIRNSVFMELKWDPKVTSDDIGVAVKDGVVTLTGFVPSYWEKNAAEKAAKRVYGVKAVANDLEVKLLSSRSDPEIGRDIVHELESHISIPANNIKATVRNGWATLDGNVDWQYQKLLAESAVKKNQRRYRRGEQH